MSTWRTTQARREDLQWMAQTGEGTAGAATRLGITRRTLMRWIETHKEWDVWAQLRANDPLPRQDRSA